MTKVIIMHSLLSTASIYNWYSMIRIAYWLLSVYRWPNGWLNGWTRKSIGSRTRTKQSREHTWGLIWIPFRTIKTLKGQVTIRIGTLQTMGTKSIKKRIGNSMTIQIMTHQMIGWEKLKWHRIGHLKGWTNLLKLIWLYQHQNHLKHQLYQKVV